MISVTTAQDMYDALSDEINKEQTGTIMPDEFERSINRGQMDYVTDRYNQVEQTQKRIDDLRELVVLDEVIFNTGNNTAEQELFVLPYNPNGNIVTPKNPSGTNNGYLFMLAASFKLTYVDSPCKNKGVSKYIKAKPMRSDKRYEIERDPFNRASEERLYYQEYSGSYIKLFTGTSSYGIEARIDYLRYPRLIQLASGLIPSVDCELALHARQEIVRLSARRYKQTIEHPTYQPQLIEDRQITT